MSLQADIDASVAFLNSDRAIKMLEADSYWPKWDGPWWHMLLLYEMGMTNLIPERAVRAHVKALNAIQLKSFPIHPGEMPPDVDPHRGTPCHCSVGNVYQVLAAWGVDVDAELPWIRPWFLKYQMADGGLNCDNDAYLVKDEVPSSMVGTIAIFESMIQHTKKPWSEADRKFIDKGARFLIERKLMLGSPTKHNKDERESAKDWGKLCFPRYYLYDVLRGLNAITLWAEITGETLPRAAIAEVVKDLETRFADGDLRTGRHSYEGAGSLIQSPEGEWLRRQPATHFPLLTRVSEIGAVSPYLSKQWADVKARLQRVRLGD